MLGKLALILVATLQVTSARLITINQDQAMKIRDILNQLISTVEIPKNMNDDILKPLEYHQDIIIAALESIEIIFSDSIDTLKSVTSKDHSQIWVNLSDRTTTVETFIGELEIWVKDLENYNSLDLESLLDLTVVFHRLLDEDTKNLFFALDKYYGDIVAQLNNIFDEINKDDYPVIDSTIMPSLNEIKMMLDKTKTTFTEILDSVKNYNNLVVNEVTPELDY